MKKRKFKLPYLSFELDLPYIHIYTDVMCYHVFDNRYDIIGVKIEIFRWRFSFRLYSPQNRL